MEQISADNSLEQVANVACLPGIVKASMAMPDIHWGYGFPVGGVAATRVDDGVVSPGGVGFDINCGVRLLRTDLTEDEVRPHIEELVDALFANVPSGLGSSGKVRLQGGEIDRVLADGARWAVDKATASPKTWNSARQAGRLPGADPDKVGARPKRRGAPQLGTLGSGNHFLEVQVVDEVFDANVARVMGVVEPGQVLVMMHCGSRGLGHQICDDYLKVMDGAVKSYGIELPDRQLACCPVESPEGRDYIAAMYAGANFAWANASASRTGCGSPSRRSSAEAGRALASSRCTTSATTSPRLRSTWSTVSARGCASTGRAPSGPFRRATPTFRRGTSQPAARAHSR